MAISNDQLWTASVTDDATNSATASGSASVGGASGLLLAFLSGGQGGNAAISTPSGWVSRGNSTDCAAFERNGGSAISSLTVNFTNGGFGPYHLHVPGYKTTLTSWQVDSNTAVNDHSTAATSLVTNALTTTLASAGNNTACVSFFCQANNASPAPTFSAPTNSYAIRGSATRDNDITPSAWLGSAVYQKIISANVSAETSGITSDKSKAYVAIVLSYNEVGSVFDPSTAQPFDEILTTHPLRSWAANRQRMSVVQMAQHFVEGWWSFANITIDPSVFAFLDQNYARPSNILWSPRRIPGSSDLRPFPFSEDVPAITNEWALSATPVRSSARVRPMSGSEREIPLPIVAAGVDQFMAWNGQQTQRPAYKARVFQADLSFSALQAPDTSGTFLLDQQPFHRQALTPRLGLNDQWVFAFQQVTIPDTGSVAAMSIQSPSPLPFARQRIGSQHAEAVSIAAPGIEYVIAPLAEQQPRPIRTRVPAITMPSAFDIIVDFIWPLPFVQADGPRAVVSSFPRRDAAAALPALLLPAGIALDWNVDQQTPIRRIVRAIPQAEDQSQWFATLTPDVVHAWDMPTNQPLLRPFAPSRAQGEDARLTLIVSAAESFAWNIENPFPLRRPFRVPRAEYFAGSPFFDTGGIIIVAGPYYTVAGDFWVSGAVTGDILGEG